MVKGDIVKFDEGVLNQAVKRNIGRFPGNYYYQLNISEYTEWKSQIVTSNGDKMGLRKRPYAFTEHGVAMLTGVPKQLKCLIYL